MNEEKIGGENTVQNCHYSATPAALFRVCIALCIQAGMAAFSSFFDFSVDESGITRYTQRAASNGAVAERLKATVC